MKLEVGMYFRTKAGTINKIDNFTEDKGEFYFNTKPIFSDGECLGSNWGYTKDIIKASYDIIDILEVGDYVNGKKIYSLGLTIGILNTINFEDGTFTIAEDIKSVITHEQIEQMEYRIGEK